MLTCWMVRLYCLEPKCPILPWIVRRARKTGNPRQAPHLRTANRVAAAPCQTCLPLRVTRSHLVESDPATTVPPWTARAHPRLNDESVPPLLFERQLGRTRMARTSTLVVKARSSPPNCYFRCPLRWWKVDAPWRTPCLTMTVNQV